MAIVKTNLLCGPDFSDISAHGAINILNDAAGEAWAFSFQVPKTGTITGVIFRAGTVTSFQNMTISLETVGTNGLPSGSNYGGSLPGTWSGGTSDTSPEVTLATSAAATVGDLVCVRGEWASTAGNLNIQYVHGYSSITREFPKVLPDTGSGFGSVAGVPMICLVYGDATYSVPVGCFPPGSFSSININSSSSPQEVGFWITPKIGIEIEGASLLSRTFGTTQQSTFALYTTPAGTPASQRSASFTHSQISATAERINVAFNPYLASASTDYVLACLQDNSNNYTLYYLDVANANHWGNFADGSALVYASRNSGGGAFTKTTTRKIIGSLILSGVDIPSSGLPKLIGNNSLLG